VITKESKNILDKIIYALADLGLKTHFIDHYFKKNADRFLEEYEVAEYEFRFSHLKDPLLHNQAVAVIAVKHKIMPPKEDVIQDYERLFNFVRDVKNKGKEHWFNQFLEAKAANMVDDFRRMNLKDIKSIEKFYHTYQKIMLLDQAIEHLKPNSTFIVEFLKFNGISDMAAINKQSDFRELKSLAAKIPIFTSSNKVNKAIALFKAINEVVAPTPTNTWREAIQNGYLEGILKTVQPRLEDEEDNVEKLRLMSQAIRELNNHFPNDPEAIKTILMEEYSDRVGLPVDELVQGKEKQYLNQQIGNIVNQWGDSKSKEYDPKLHQSISGYLKQHVPESNNQSLKLLRLIQRLGQLNSAIRFVQELDIPQFKQTTVELLKGISQSADVNGLSSKLAEFLNKTKIEDIEKLKTFVEYYEKAGRYAKDEFIQFVKEDAGNTRVEDLRRAFNLGRLNIMQKDLSASLKLNEAMLEKLFPQWFANSDVTNGDKYIKDEALGDFNSTGKEIVALKDLYRQYNDAGFSKIFQSVVASSQVSDAKTAIKELNQSLITLEEAFKQFSEGELAKNFEKYALKDLFIERLKTQITSMDDLENLDLKPYHDKANELNTFFKDELFVIANKKLIRAWFSDSKELFEDRRSLERLNQLLNNIPPIFSNQIEQMKRSILANKDYWDVIDIEPSVIKVGDRAFLIVKSYVKKPQDPNVKNKTAQFEQDMLKSWPNSNNMVMLLTESGKQTVYPVVDDPKKLHDTLVRISQQMEEIKKRGEPFATYVINYLIKHPQYEPGDFLKQPLEKQVELLVPTMIKELRLDGKRFNEKVIAAKLKELKITTHDRFIDLVSMLKLENQVRK